MLLQLRYIVHETPLHKKISKHRNENTSMKNWPRVNGKDANGFQRWQSNTMITSDQDCVLRRKQLLQWCLNSFFMTFVTTVFLLVSYPEKRCLCLVLKKDAFVLSYGNQICSVRSSRTPFICSGRVLSLIHVPWSTVWVLSRHGDQKDMMLVKSLNFSFML